MGTCSGCGNKGFFLKTVVCRMCGKEGCKKCMNYLFTVYRYSSSHPTDGDWFCHHGQCYETLAKKIENSITADVLSSDKFGVELLRYGFFNAMKKAENRNWIGDNLSPSISPDDFLFVSSNSEFIAKIGGFAKEKRF